MYNVEIRQKDTSLEASFFVYVWRVIYVRVAFKNSYFYTYGFMGDCNIYTGKCRKGGL